MEQDRRLRAGWDATARSWPQSSADDGTEVPSEPVASDLTDDLLGPGLAATADPASAAQPRAAAGDHPALVTARPRRSAAATAGRSTWVDRMTPAKLLTIVGGGLAAAVVLALLIVSLGRGGETAPAPMGQMQFQGAVLPVSDVAGPRTVTATQVEGFERSPVGASLAAVHLTARTDYAAGPAIFTATIQHQVAGDAKGMLADRTAAYEAYLKANPGHHAGDPVPATRNRVIGWTVPDWHDGTGDVVVRLLVEKPADVSGGNPLTWVGVTMRWDEAAGDWKLTDAAYTSGAETQANTYELFFGQDQ